MGRMLGTRELLSIGRFGRLSGLTVKALRHYDEIGLLRPAHVDDWTGYRYYALSQARDAEAIRRLRALEVPLDEVAELIGADDATLRERLAVHRARVEGRAVEVQAILTELDRLIDGEEQLVPTEDKVQIRFEMEVREVPERRVAVVRERGHESEMSEVIPRQIETVGGYLKEIGARPLGAPICVCPFPDTGGMLSPETGWPVADNVQARPPIEVKTYPATRALVYKHVGPYEQLSRSYRLMAEVMERQGLTPTGEPIEIYESDPQEVTDPNEYVTFIEWPIAEGGTWPPEVDYFRRRVDPD
jgi:DNA-binding transcriptional MerR regulator